MVECSRLFRSKLTSVCLLQSSVLAAEQLIGNKVTELAVLHPRIEISRLRWIWPLHQPPRWRNTDYKQQQPDDLTVLHKFGIVDYRGAQPAAWL